MKKLVILFLILAFPVFGDNLESQFDLNISHDFSRATGTRTTRDSGRFQNMVSFVFGTGTGTEEIDAVYNSRGTATPTPTVYDLCVLTDAFGDPLSFARVKTLAVKNLSGTENIVIGGGAGAWPGIASGTAQESIITPGGCLVWCSPLSGFGVTSGTANIRIYSAATASFDLFISGLKN